MKFMGHRIAFAFAAVFFALAGKGDDAVGVMRTTLGIASREYFTKAYLLVLWGPIGPTNNDEWRWN